MAFASYLPRQWVGDGQMALAFPLVAPDLFPTGRRATAIAAAPPTLPPGWLPGATSALTPSTREEALAIPRGTPHGGVALLATPT